MWKSTTVFKMEKTMQQHLKKENHFTVNDYMNWDDENRYELLDGIVYDFAPAPNIKHQSLVSNLFGKIYSLLQGKKCLPFVSPTDVVLSEDTVVQPDIMIICDKSKLTEQNIAGAPDVIFEIISPSTGYKDKQIKLYLYEKYGVKEYFIVFPDEELVEYYILKNNKYHIPEILGWKDVLIINTVKIELKLWEIFNKELPKEENEETSQVFENL